MPKRKTILIVEDNEDLRNICVASLESVVWKIQSTTSVAMAINVVRSEVVHCVLTDIGLPDGDGFELLREVKVLKPTLPVVFMTAATHWKRDYALSMGALELFYKPLHFDEVKNLLCELLGA